MKNLERYSRQILLPEIREQGQQMIGEASVLIVGVGGLGTLVAQYLAMAGVGKIGLMDFDRVSKSNLNRQVLYTEKDLGVVKVEAAKMRLMEINTSLNYQTFNEILSTENAKDIFSKFDLIIDGTDNIISKYIINDACNALNKPWVYGSIYRFEGQVSVFNYDNGPTYRCLYPENDNQVLSCEEAGVVGVVSATVAIQQATEALKIILKKENILSGKLLVTNVLSHKTAFFGIQKSNIETKTNKFQIPADALILDVRNESETPEPDFENVLKIPMNILEENTGGIPKNKTVYVLCQSGIRSAKAVEILKNNFGFENLINVAGGIFNLTKI
ncbi:MAG: HesA/MoeB/ThiF family protein [Bacteroidetes bacterium]|nr:HesA/MoeB/ThiF family protein [Bacteroidota bacterium]